MFLPLSDPGNTLKRFLPSRGTQALAGLAFSMKLLGLGALVGLPIRIVECDEAL